MKDNNSPFNKWFLAIPVRTAIITFLSVSLGGIGGTFILFPEIFLRDPTNVILKNIMAASLATIFFYWYAKKLKRQGKY